MSDAVKIAVSVQRVRQLADVTDLVALLFPANRNQQYAAARILLALRAAAGPVGELADLAAREGISRRTLERTRGKLARLGLIERVTWMHRRYGGQQGWVLSGRLSTTLRQLAERIDAWRDAPTPELVAKEDVLALALRR
jgi:hypothetical protein